MAAANRRANGPAADRGFRAAAGPGTSGPGTGTLHSYAQRQALQFDSVSGKWLQPTGDADILYAPTDSCSYAGGGTFWYDRNLNGAIDEASSDLEVTSPDLMGTGSYASIEARIAASGFTKPAFFGSGGDQPRSDGHRELCLDRGAHRSQRLHQARLLRIWR
ncbi:hypothetical protein QVG61_06485 [Thiohalobacter sp. IOR34]|uniref:hypothetical protein n=1 Tax=Thiohalobacter sp. IOR34 TaxID=3057176 RepID=UPI0025B1793B|nr:hypothetical protein [Thiohalobacter sp. IOR34]WJW76728.1 hypothetical protein QVG61_06485 [Thiohalobacter sp. IOR34]